MELTAPFATPSVFVSRPVRVWLVMGLFAVYLVFCLSLLFDTITPLADFPLQPAIEADSGTYWAAAGIKRSGGYSDQSSGFDFTGNLFGPVIQAKLLRTDFNVMLSNCLLFFSCLWLLRAMPEFDRAVFLLLMMANPFLIASLITLNKEIFALAGVVYFIAYTRATRYRLPLLVAALLISLMARWQQTFVMLLFVLYEAKLSPLRRHRRIAIAITLLGFTIAYTLINQLFPTIFEALLIQAQAGRTIILLDQVQARFGFPLVVIPKILMNCMGRLVSPSYFLNDYPLEDFTNWRDQIFMHLHTLLLTVLLLSLFLSRKLRLHYETVYLLVLYLLMTAVNPMVQPRYEYTSYVLLCLEACRHWRLQAPSVPSARLHLLSGSAPT